MLTSKQKERQQKALAGVEKAKSNRIESYILNPSKCNFCKKELDYERRKNKFCSRNCAISHNNVGIVRNFVNGVFSKKQCVWCGKTTRNEKFCSRICCNESHIDAYLIKIKQTGLLDCHPSVAKKYLIKTRGHKCEICKLTKWQSGLIPLVLDHINGLPKDNRVVNLRLVCGNCNMLLPTFAGRNVGRGGGRPYRNKRYMESKSY